MNNKFSLLGRTEYKLTDRLIIHIPLVSEIRDSYQDEIEYYRLISIFIRTPCDAMVELDDIGIDYTKVKEYELFVMTMLEILNSKNLIDSRYWNMIFPYIDMSELRIDVRNEECIIINTQGEVIIDEKIYLQLADLLRQIISADKNMEYYKVPEEETRRYIIDRQRLKQKRVLERQAKNGKKTSSVLDGVILLLVNNCNFKYNFATVGEITIYDLYACLHQIYSDREIDGLMTGYWSGNVDLKKVDSSKLNRIIL